jgi:hypothetical protein
MKRRLRYFLVMAVIFVSAGIAGKVSLQDVNNFPELYVGSPIEIEGVNLKGRIKKDMGFYCLGVEAAEVAKDKRTGDKEGQADRFLNMARLTFVADADLARKLLNEMEGSKTYPVKIRCAVERVEEVGNIYWIARVSQVAFSSPDGSTTKTVSADSGGGHDVKGSDAVKKQPK